MTPFLWILLVLCILGIRDGLIIMQTYRVMGWIIFLCSSTLALYIVAEGTHLVHFL